MWNLKHTHRDSKSGWQGQVGGALGDVGQRVQSWSYARWMSSGDLRYSMGIAVNNTTCLKFAKKVDKCLTTGGKKQGRGEGKKMVTTWNDGYVSWLDCSNHLIMLKYIKTSNLYPTYIWFLWVNYINTSTKLQEINQQSNDRELKCEIVNMTKSPEIHCGKNMPAHLKWIFILTGNDTIIVLHYFHTLDFWHINKSLSVLFLLKKENHFNHKLKEKCY